MDFIEPCFGIGHNLSLICQMTSEDIKHQLIINLGRSHHCLSGDNPASGKSNSNSNRSRQTNWTKTFNRFLYLFAFHHSGGVKDNANPEFHVTLQEEEPVMRCTHTLRCKREPVWPSGKALGWQVEGPRLDYASALLSLEKGCGLWTRSCDFVSHK